MKYTFIMNTKHTGMCVKRHVRQTLQTKIIFRKSVVYTLREDVMMLQCPSAYFQSSIDRVVFVRGGFCPGGILSGGVFVQVVFVRVVFVRGGFCPYTIQTSETKQTSQKADKLNHA